MPATPLQFTPHGLTFTTPVTIEIPYVASAIQSNDRACMLKAVGGSVAAWDMSLVVEGWLDWRGWAGFRDATAVHRQHSRSEAQVARSGVRDEPASGTRQQCAGGADAEGLGWLSDA
ncbi:hypothetical protein CYMTET_52688 [Cymbomonas tetramitiformis]|uniref:Uncharacterized protein n=1 Tax=Cymbomonas tetramitiformis TaxID=36881 RepID=A0AAE0ERD7_9CHLO|nr:hypothetical protein CYMTET_52688 [Cymbomonas tetramitiformis]